MLNLSLAVYETIAPHQKLTKSDDTIVCNPVKQATLGVHKKIHQTNYKKLKYTRQMNF